MQSVEFIINLKRTLNGNEGSQVISALKQDPLIWETLQEEGFINKVVDIANKTNKIWTPANLAVTAIGESNLKAEELSSALLPPLELTFQQKVLQIYEEFIKTPRVPETLAEAGSLALALRERLILTKSWEGFYKEIIFDPERLNKSVYLVWRTPLACLYGLIPDPIAMLKSFRPNLEENLAYAWISHVLLSNTLSQDEQIQIFKDFLKEEDLEQRVNWLKRLNLAGHKKLVSILANQVLVDQQIQDSSSVNIDQEPANLEAILNCANILQKQASLYQLSNQTDQSKSTLNKAKRVAQYFMTGLNIQLVNNNRENENSQDVENILEQTTNMDLVPPYLQEELLLAVGNLIHLENVLDHLSSNNENPFVQIRRAGLLFQKGKESEAKNLACVAVENLGGMVQRGEDIFYPKFFNNWEPEVYIQELCRLNLFPEAQKCGLLLMRLYPIDAGLLNEMCKLCQLMGDVPQAMYYAQTFSMLDPENPDSHRRIAELYEVQEDWVKSFEEWQKVLRFVEQPGSSDWLALAKSALNVNQNRLVLDACQIVLDTEPDNGRAHAILGKGLVAMGETENAIHRLSRATVLSPQDMDSWLLLAEMQKKINHPELSLETLRKAAATLSESAVVNHVLADECLSQDFSSEALYYAQKATTLNPDSIQFVITLGKVLHSLKLLEEAKSVLGKAMQKWQGDGELAYIFGKVLYDLGEYEASIPVLAISLTPAPPAKERLILYASALIGDDSLVKLEDPGIAPDRLANAQQILEQVLLTDAEDFQTRLMLAEVLKSRGDFKAAFSEYKKLEGHPSLQLPDWRWRMQVGLGQTALGLSCNEVALVSLQEAVNERPDNLYFNHLLAEAYLASDLTDSAVDVALHSRKIAPDDLKNLSWFADIMMRCGKEEEAIKVLEQMMQLDAVCFDYPVQLARLYIKTGDETAARHILESLLLTKRIDERILREICHSFVSLKDDMSALACLERALELSQADQPDILLEMAYLHWRLGNSDRSLKEIKTAIDKDPSDAFLYILQADLQALLDHPQEALASLDNALRITNGNSVDIKDYWSRIEKINDGKNIYNLRCYKGEAAIHFRYALLLHRTGNLFLALHYIKSALELDPTSVVLRYMAVDLALALQHDDAMKLMEPLLPNGVDSHPELYNSLNPVDKEVYLDLMALKIEGGLADLNLSLVNDLLKQAQLLSPIYPRFLAAQARLYALQGDLNGAEDSYRAMQSQMGSLGFSNGPAVQYENWFDKYLLGIMPETASRLWTAETALEVQKWDEAMELFDGYVQTNAHEPRAYLSSAKALVICTEWQRFYAELKSISRAPNPRWTDNEGFKKFKDLILTAERFSASRQINRWHTRGKVAYNPTKENLEEFKTHASNPGDIAALISGLRQINDTAGVADLARQYRDVSQVAMQILLCGKEAIRENGVNAGEIVEKRQKDPVCHVIVATVAEGDGQWQLALQSMQAALAFWDNEPEWHVWASKLAEQYGTCEAVLEHLEKATSLDPTSVKYPLSLGNAYMNYGEVDKAIHVLETINRRIPEQYEILMALSQAYQQNKRLGEAFETAEHASKLEDRSANALLLCGELALENGKLAQALDYAKTAKQKYPDDAEVILFLSRVLVKAGHEEEGLTVLEQRLVDASLPIQLEHVNLLRQIRGDHAALALMENLAGQHPDDVSVLTLLAQIQYACGKLKDAEDTGRSVLFIEPENPAMNLLMGRLSRHAGQLDQALHYFSSAVLQSTDDMDLYLELGEIYRERRENLQALQIYRRAINAKPNDYRPYYQAAVVLRESKDYPGAETMLRQAAELAPDNLLIHRQLGAIVALNLVHNPQEVSLQ